MGYSRSDRGIGSPDRRLDYGNTRPMRFNQNLQFKLIPACLDLQIHGFRQGIYPETALGITGPGAARQPYPEIGEFAPKGAGPRYVSARHPLPGPHHNRPGRVRYGLHQRQGITGIMLPVGIQGDGPVGLFHRPFEPGLKGRPLAPVDGMGQYRGGGSLQQPRNRRGRR